MNEITDFQAMAATTALKAMFTKKHFSICDVDAIAETLVHCAVAASGSDINMTNGLTVAAGDTVSCSSLTYTALSA